MGDIGVTPECLTSLSNSDASKVTHMLNIHNAHNFERVLPEHMELLLCERDQILNRLAPKQLMETLKAPERKIVMYQVTSINAAH
jgi:hypothetical protein